MDHYTHNPEIKVGSGLVAHPLNGPRVAICEVGLSSGLGVQTFPFIEIGKMSRMPCITRLDVFRPFSCQT